MSLSVSQVRLVFGVDRINDVAVSSNWLYLTGGPSSVCQINLDSPSNVHDILIPKKHANSGFIKLLVASPSGKSLLAVTNKYEHFFYSQSQSNKAEFRHLGKLKGTKTICAAFYPKQRGIMLLGTKTGSIVEISIDSAGNETYFKRDLRLMKNVWIAPQKEQISSLLIGNSRNLEVTITYRNQVLRWTSEPPKSDLEDSVFAGMFKEPEVLVSGEGEASQLRLSPDSRTMACLFGTSVIKYSRRSTSSGKVQQWEEQQIAGDVKHFMMTNYYFMATVSDASGSAILAVNMLDPKTVIFEPSEPMVGVATDRSESTYWLFDSQNLFEVKLNDELRGMYKVLTDMQKFEEAMDVAENRQEKSYVLENQGRLLLKTSPDRGAELLGASDMPMGEAALLVSETSQQDLPSLLNARLNHTKSRAQQIMLTSWLAQLGDVSFLKRSAVYDPETLQQIFEEKGQSDLYLEVSTKAGDIHAVVSFFVAQREWFKALESLLQNEPKSFDLVYQYASILLENSPKQCVDAWLRMPDLDVERLLPSLVTYNSKFRGPLEENQAYRYLTKYLSVSKTRNGSVFNVCVTILCSSLNKEKLLDFLKRYAPQFKDLDFTLRMCLNYNQNESAVYLYTIQGLYEDAVQLCLLTGEDEMYQRAIEIADKHAGVNEELRKLLLRDIAQHLIATQGPQAASRFVGLLRVSDLLQHFPEFETLNELAPEIIKSLEMMNARLSTLNNEIDESLNASEQMQQELSTFNRRSVLIEPGEECFLCKFPLVTRKFVVFPCQHGFHVDCTQKKLDEWGKSRNITDECILCCRDNIQQIDEGLSSSF